MSFQRLLRGRVVNDAQMRLCPVLVVSMSMRLEYTNLKHDTTTAQFTKESYKWHTLFRRAGAILQLLVGAA